MTHELKVGQTLWYVPDRQRWSDPCEVTIEKIGRKWATLQGHYGRVDIETLCIDGGRYSSPGSCYISKEAYEAQVALNRAWAAFRKSVDRQHAPPSDCTMHKIEAAAASLGLTLGTVS